MAPKRTRGNPAGQPLRNLPKEVEAAYAATMDRMLAEILRYMAGALGLPKDTLRKAKDPQKWLRALSIVSPEQLRRIRELIRDFHDGFAVGVIGPDVVSPEQLARLRKEGIIPEKLGEAIIAKRRGLKGVEGPAAFTDKAYDFGAYQANPDQRAAVEAMQPLEFEEHRRAVGLPLTLGEQHAKTWARHNAGQYIQGLGDRVGMEVQAAVMQADLSERRKFIDAVQEETSEAIDARKPWRELAQELGKRTGDWSRGMRRVANTELEFARQEGQVRAMARTRNPKDIRVAKVPAPDACPDCVRLHLTAGPGSPPKVFLLSELTANGNNVGVKRDAWLPGVGPVHPHCHCVLTEVPDGWSFNDDGDLVPDVLLKKAMATPDIPPPKMLTYSAVAPEKGCSVRISDPRIRQVVDHIVASAPPEIFDKKVGVTLITTDDPRPGNPLEEHDLAYWTGNEIRMSQNIDLDRVPRVLRHELGHSLNVWLFHTLGGLDAVRTWHDALDAVSADEGRVSDYAKLQPIENAAEVTRMYLFQGAQLMLKYPRQFTFCHRAYAPIFKQRARSIVSAEESPTREG